MISRYNGRKIDAERHLIQSIRDITETPINSREGIRDGDRQYGSRLPRLMGRPLNDDTQAEAVASTAQALAQWEPRLRISNVKVAAFEGQLLISLTDADGRQIEFTL